MDLNLSAMRFRRHGARLLGAAIVALTCAVPCAFAGSPASGQSPAPSSAPAEKPKNLLLNPDFLTGSGNSPDDWRTEAWNESPSSTTYRWIPPSGTSGGQLEISSAKPNDARWVQTLTLSPGWYFVSAELRTEGVGTKVIGASISLLEDSVMSPDARGTTNWRKVGFYLKIGPRSDDVDVALRLGGYSNLNHGLALFRHASVVRITSPPPGARPIFDLAMIRRASAPRPIGKPWSVVAVFVALAAIAAWSWRQLGRTAPTPSTSKRRRRDEGGSHRKGRG